jgi:hypothetical protein
MIFSGRPLIYVMVLVSQTNMTFYKKNTSKDSMALKLQQDTDAVAFADHGFPAEAILPGFWFWTQILILYTDPAIVNTDLSLQLLSCSPSPALRVPDHGGGRRK